MTKRIRHGCDYRPTSSPTPTKLDPTVPPSLELNPNRPDLPTPDDATFVPRNTVAPSPCAEVPQFHDMILIRCRDECREVVVSNKARRPELYWGQRARGRLCADDCVGKCVAGRRVVGRSVER